MLKIAGQFVVRIEPQLQLNPDRPFHCEIYIRRLHLNVRERRAFQAEAGDDNRSDPRGIFLRKIDNYG